MRVGSWLAVAGDLLLGARCPGCHRPGYGVCAGCHEVLSAAAPRLTRPDPCPPGFPLTAAAGPYGPVLSRLVSAHKEDQVLLLAPVLGDRLALAVRCLVAAGGPPGPVVLVPVPSTPAAVRRRGYDATLALARRAAGRCASGPVPVRRLLSHRRRVQDQAGLDAAARRSNLAGSLRARGDGLPPGAAVVLVDDLVTTGSSLVEAARALRAAGVPVLGAATVAATVRSRPPGRGG